MLSHNSPPPHPLVLLVLEHDASDHLKVIYTISYSYSCGEDLSTLSSFNDYKIEPSSGRPYYSMKNNIFLLFATSSCDRIISRLQTLFFRIFILFGYFCQLISYLILLCNYREKTVTSRGSFEIKLAVPVVIYHSSCVQVLSLYTTPSHSCR